jgi:hypothetical protein
MANLPDEGRGATLTLGTSSWDTTALITNITPDAITRASLENTHLGTTNYRTFQPEELLTAGGFTIEFYHDGDAEPPINAAAETVTVTYPLQQAYATAALITGSGFCDSYTPGSAEVGSLMKGSAHFVWAGGITFTDHT